jgi:hypothetical protein
MLPGFCRPVLRDVGSLRKVAARLEFSSDTASSTRETAARSPTFSKQSL